MNASSLRSKLRHSLPLLGLGAAIGVAGFELYERTRHTYEIVAVFDGKTESVRAGFLIDGYAPVERLRFRPDPDSPRSVAIYHPVRSGSAAVELLAGERGSDSGPPFRADLAVEISANGSRHCVVVARIIAGGAHVGDCIPVERGPAVLRQEFIRAVPAG